MTKRSRAYCLIREQPHYRREAFAAGLAAEGYEVSFRAPAVAAAGDLLVIWNRYGTGHQLAEAQERAGGTVVVAENGYLARGGGTPKFDGGHYALAIGGHNGSGRWPDRRGARWLEETDEYGARWRALGIDLFPPRLDGGHVLVCPNRSFGRPGFIMPTDWAERTVRRLQAITRREVRLRPHPGNGRPQRPLEADLEGAHAVVIWSSSAGVHALVHGVQVVCEAPAWILKDVACARLEDIDQVTLGERLPSFERLAWAQWTVEEIGSGLAFRHLLSDPEKGEVEKAA